MLGNFLKRKEKEERGKEEEGRKEEMQEGGVFIVKKSIK